jgi:hypothetical protein
MVIADPGDRAMTTKEALYRRLIDDVPADDLRTAEALLELLRARRRLGRLKFDKLKGLSAADLVALRNALVHARWALNQAGRIPLDDPVLRAFMEAPDDDEPVTPEEEAAIAEAREAVARGEVEPWDKVRAELFGQG